MDDELTAERDEPGGESAAAILRDPGVLLIVMRDDGKVAVATGLPPGVSPGDLDAPIVVAGGAEPVVSVILGPGDDELAAQFGCFRDDRAAVLSLVDPRRGLGALGFAHWRRRTRFCGRCAASLSPREDGRALACVRCGAEHFPRLEPAVIVRVLDAADRILLGRQPTWPEGRFSVLAGFVDPGESVENAIRREVREEVGVTVGEVTYVGSQPWPFPASLMLGWSARAETTTITLGDDEIAEAHWYSRDDLRAAMAAGEVHVPPNVSIAHRLITEWLGDTRIRTWLD